MGRRRGRGGGGGGVGKKNSECRFPHTQPVDLAQQPGHNYEPGIDKNHSRGAFCACASATSSMM